MPFAARTQAMKSWFLDKSKQKSNFHLFQKTLRRLILLYFSGQWRLRRDKIDKNVKTILWIHTADHTGDSLMRLSSAQLINDFNVDLYVHPCASNLFLSGELFRQVFTIGKDKVQVLKNQYDLIIIDDFKSGPIKLKKSLFPKTPYIAFHEFFDYCRDDFNFIYFAWHRMAYLLRGIKNCGDVETKACLTMSIANEAKDTANHLPIKENAIAIVVGGKEAYRDYQAWSEVIKKLIEANPEQQVVLVGSDNGCKSRDAVLRQVNAENIIDCVAQYSLMETAAIISKCRLMVCADGGLLHIANAVGVPAFVLFAAVKPEFRCTQAMEKFATYTETNVNDISPDQLAASVIAI